MSNQIGLAEQSVAAEPTFFAAADSLTGPIPPLENGDHLTRNEFERRFEAMPHLKKAELIEGIVYMPAAAIRLDQHGKPHFRLIGWLGAYEAATPGIAGGDNSSIRLDLDNEPQPDAMLMIDSDRGGQAVVDDDGYVARAPELVAEVSASTVSLDMHAKFRVYRRNGVREYIVWRVLDRQIDWFVLRAGEFEPLAVNDGGLLCSEAFPGLWLDSQALVRGDLKAVHFALSQGLASEGHAAFVARLESARKR